MERQYYRSGVFIVDLEHISIMNTFHNILQHISASINLSWVYALKLRKLYAKYKYKS